MGLTVAAATATLVLGSGGVALAHGDDDEGPAAPAGAGEWTPFPEEAYEPFDIEACGGPGELVTVSSGDVRQGEQRETVLADGATFVEYRGALTVDVLRHSDGASLDEIEVSGAGWDLFSADGSEAVTSIDGPSLIGVPPDPVFQAAFEAVGLPPLVYWAEDAALARAVTDPDSGAVVQVDVLRVPADVVDVCDLLDQAVAHHHDGAH
ncbi:hypothetical protein [Blastococcus sp. SYSU D00695]